MYISLNIYKEEEKYVAGWRNYVRVYLSKMTALCLYINILWVCKHKSLPEITVNYKSNAKLSGLKICGVISAKVKIQKITKKASELRYTKTKCSQRNETNIRRKQSLAVKG